MNEREQIVFQRQATRKNWVKNGIRSPYNIMVAAAAAALACLVIVPLIEMVVTTFKLAARGREDGGAQAEAFVALLEKAAVQRSLPKHALQAADTLLLIATAVSVFSIGLGGAIAWLMVRGDLPFEIFLSGNDRASPPGASPWLDCGVQDGAHRRDQGFLSYQGWNRRTGWPTGRWRSSAC